MTIGCDSGADCRCSTRAIGCGTGCCIIIAIWSLAVAGTVIGVVGGMSLINVFIETAESAFEKKRKKSDDEEESEEPDAEEETKELGKRVSALEHAMRQKDDALKKILAAVSR